MVSEKRDERDVVPSAQVDFTGIAEHEIDTGIDISRYEVHTYEMLPCEDQLIKCLHMPVASSHLGPG